MSTPDPLLDRLLAEADGTDRVLEDRALHAVKQALLGVSSPAPTARLGRYVLDRRLGRGSAGTVYLARDPQLDRDVAVKLLQTSRVSEAQRDHLMHEARALAQLCHPHIVVVHDVGCVGADDASVARPGSVFIVMELLEGTTLERWLAARPRSLRAILRAFIDAGRGLAAAHRAGVIHRDFKAHNVMVTTRAEIKVVDFGLARGLRGHSPPPAGDAPQAASSLREVTSAAGTPLYMAPELAAGAPADARSDQYSFAVSLGRALTGEDPFPSGDWSTLLEAKRRGPTAWNDAALPRGLAAALRRAMSPEIEQRYPSMEPLLAALARYTKRRRWVAGVALGLTAGLAATVGVATAGTCRPPRALWTEAERHQTQQVFVHSGVADATPRFARVDATLTWADDALRELGDRACDAPALRACVRGRHAHQAAVTDALLKANPRVIERSDALLEALDDPRDCARAPAAADELPASVERDELDALVAQRLDPTTHSDAEVRKRAQRWAQRERWWLATQWQRLLCRAGTPRIDDAERHCRRASEFARRSGHASAMIASWIRHAHVLHEHGHAAPAQLLLQMASPALESASPALARVAERLHEASTPPEPHR